MDNEPEPIWAVLVIHGVGFTRPGETLENFVTGLRENGYGDRIKEIGSPQVRMLMKAEEKLPSCEYTERDYQDPRVPLKDRFPMHLRNVRIENPTAGTPRNAIFAEVFWSDLSTTRNRALDILLRLVTIIFQLRFVMDRAAKAPDGSGRWMRLFVYFASSLLCGPIAALSVSLVVLLGSNYVADWVPGSIDRNALVAIVGILLCIGAIALWYKLATFRNDSPWGPLLFWIAVISVGIAIFAGSYYCEVLDNENDWITQFIISKFKLTDIPTGFSLYYFVLMMITRGMLFLMLFFLLAGSLAWLLSVIRALYEGKTMLIPGLTAGLGTLVLQVGLWVLIIPALGFWILQKLKLDGSDTAALVMWLQTSYTANVLLALVVSLSVALTLACRFLWSVIHAKDYADPRQRRYIPRLLINNLIFVSLISVSIIGSLLSFSDFEFFDNLVHTVSPWVTTLVVFGVAASLLWLSPLRSGLHILMDIVSHFIMTKLPVPWPFGPERVFGLNDLVRQMKIEARFRRVLEEITKDGNASHLTVVSHSQGAALAVDVLWYNWTASLLRKKKVVHLYLITMGCPFTHLYQKYFPDRYPALFKSGKFNDDDTGWGWGKLYETFESRKPNSKWINLYRVDDPIGTHIDGDDMGTFPFNFILPFGGHIGYWRDPDVIKKMKDLLPG